MRTSAFKANLLLMITAVIWGAAFVAQRLGMEHMGPFTFNGVRFALGALALIPLMRRSEGLLPPPDFAEQPTPRTYLKAGAIAGIALFAGATLQQVGMVYTTAGKGGFITGLYVVIVPLLGLFFKKKTELGAWAGAMLAAVGLYLLSVTESFTIEYGDLLVLVGAFFWAGHVLVIAWLSPRLNPVKLAAAQFATCSILSLIAALATETITLSGLAGGAGAIAYGGLMSVGVAYTLQVVAQRDAEPTHAAIILSLEAVFAAAAGWIVLGETMSLRGFLGCGLMLAGMLLSQLIPTTSNRAEQGG
jgi:drug/metabolite transporter (DMT)-like permease